MVDNVFIFRVVLKGEAKELPVAVHASDIKQAGEKLEAKYGDKLVMVYTEAEAPAITYKIKIGALEKEIPQYQFDKRTFEVDFGGVKLLFNHGPEGVYVLNGVDGHGRNVKDIYRNEKVIVS